MTSSITPLHKTNYASLTCFLVYPVFYYIIGFEKGQDVEVSKRYQTLVTPSGWAFSIWGIIFSFEIIYTMCQMHKKYRAHPMVQQGVSWWFSTTCLGELFWSISFDNELMLLSIVFMTCILASLIKIKANQYRVTSDGTNLEFWVLKFPFDVHLGWICAAFILNINVAAVKFQASSSVLFGLAIASIVYIIGVSCFCLFVMKLPNLIIPVVLAWAAFGIAMELRSPMAAISDNFSETQIMVIRTVSAAVSALSVAVTVIRAMWQLKSNSGLFAGQGTPMLNANASEVV